MAASNVPGIQTHPSPQEGRTSPGEEHTEAAQAVSLLGLSSDEMFPTDNQTMPARQAPAASTTTTTRHPEHATQQLLPPEGNNAVSRPSNGSKYFV